jgi:hypothetical protein
LIVGAVAALMEARLRSVCFTFTDWILDLQVERETVEEEERVGRPPEALDTLEDLVDLTEA